MSRTIQLSLALMVVGTVFFSGCNTETETGVERSETAAAGAESTPAEPVSPAAGQSETGQSESSTAGITKGPFGKTTEGVEVEIFNQKCRQRQEHHDDRSSWLW